MTLGEHRQITFDGNIRRSRSKKIEKPLPESRLPTLGEGGSGSERQWRRETCEAEGGVRGKEITEERDEQLTRTPLARIPEATQGQESPKYPPRR
jgi:hypothetical protein